MTGTTGARRAGTFLPLLLLVLVALIVGFLNTNFVEPYTSPRAVADDHGAYLFYDTAERGASSERAFLLRRFSDGVHYDKPQRIEGSLASAAILSEENLVCLFNSRAEGDFFSVYARGRQLEREWVGTASAETESLGFDARYMAPLGGRLYAFGTTAKGGALRAARLEADTGGEHRSWRLVPLAARIDKAAEPPGPEVEGTDEPGASIPAPVAWTSAEEADGKLALFFRVQRARPRGGLRTGEALPGEVRLVRFDGTAFVGSEMTALEDYTGLAAVALPAESGAVTTEVHVFAVRRGDEEPRIHELALEGTKLRPLAAIPYKKGGFFEDRPAQALAAWARKGRVTLFAQVGGAVRIVSSEGGRFGEWEDVARMPPEALALVYFYLGSLLALGAVMVLAGLWTLRQRLVRRTAPDLDEATANRLVAEALGTRGAAVATEAPRPSRTPAPTTEEEDPAENDAPIHDRLVAFLIDLAIVGGLLSVVRSSFQIELTAKPGEDQTRTLALLAWCTLALLGYLTVCEAVFGRTPGKRLLGLEIKTIDGKEPSLAARLYRNLFRIELIFFATVIQIPPLGDQRIGAIPIPLIALAIMLATPRAQRPGDLVAGTVVQRARDPRPPASSAVAEEEEA
jgi:uncharacterized RDD family membrane protein YckC